MAKKTFIKDFDKACKKLGRSNEMPVFPEHCRTEFENRYKLEMIAEANGGGVGIDWKNRDQLKYYPWFWLENDDKKKSGFGLSFHDCGYVYDDTYAALGSRLYFLDKEAARFMGENCADLYTAIIGG